MTEEMTQFLIDNPNCRSQETLLHTAIINNNVEVVRFLIKAGIDITCINGMTIDNSRKEGQKIVNILFKAAIKNVKKLNKLNKKGN